MSVGIDVIKAHLDVALIAGEVWSLASNRLGWAEQVRDAMAAHGEMTPEPAQGRHCPVGKRLVETVAADPDLAMRDRLASSDPGAGPVLIWILMIHLPEQGRLTHLSSPPMIARAKP